jgi:hypothetical protein
VFAGVLRENEVEAANPIRELRQLNPPLLARANGDPLPKVQTSDPAASLNGVAAFDKLSPEDEPARSGDSSRPPPMAHFPGMIFEAPRNAYHDNHQPGLH